MVIPWGPMEVSDPHRLQEKANEYIAFINQDAKPTEFTFGEMGDYMIEFVWMCYNVSNVITLAMLTRWQGFWASGAVIVH